MKDDTILWAWQETARRVLANPDEIPDKDRLWVGDLMQRQLSLIPQLIQAVEDEDAVQAGRLGIQVGAAMGRWGEQSWSRSVEDALDAAQPDIQRGRKITAAAAEGGRERKGTRKHNDVDDETLKREVQELMDRGVKITKARIAVGKRHGIKSLTTMTRRTR